MTIKEILNLGIIALKNENIDGPKSKARALLEYTLNKSREFLIIYDTKQVSAKQKNEYIKNINRLIKGEPLQYITGVQEFMKLRINVNRDVLIPQPDTEILVEEVIKICKEKSAPKILDLCTGSGAIAISLAKNIPSSRITATDISEKALKIAEENAKFHHVKYNINFVKSDLFDKIKKDKFDIIVSNPPYIPTSEIKKLPKDVQNEPKIALDGGKDGLEFYRKIVENAYKFLNNNGFLCLEIGYNQKNDIKKIIDKNLNYTNLYVKKDFGERDRIVVAKRTVPICKKLLDFFLYI